MMGISHLEALVRQIRMTSMTIARKLTVGVYAYTMRRC